MTWTFPDRTATAPAQILGSFSPASGSWLWDGRTGASSPGRAAPPGASGTGRPGPDPSRSSRSAWSP
ncbi:DUF6882 domain-containing protein [Streptomyces coeruleoprunus]|uniref:DUF6882 domain-containing protein n=1 Tax=Streptomyces coeruleoprunus TaxID=285563 RepID=A0ABV9XFA1_9ACTN